MKSILAKTGCIVIAFFVSIVLPIMFVVWGIRTGKQIIYDHTEITRVVIIDDGYGGTPDPEVISLTPQGWVDFLLFYPSNGSTEIPSLDFENDHVFKFRTVDPSVVFSSDEAEHFVMERHLVDEIATSLPEKGYSGAIKGPRMLLSYIQVEDGISFQLSSADKSVT